MAGKDFIPLKAKSEVRVRKLNKMGTALRAENRKEEIGIWAYMTRNGLEKQSNYNNAEATIAEFL